MIIRLGIFASLLINIHILNVLNEFSNSNFSHVKKYRYQFDNHMEMLEDYLESDQSSKACEEASKAALLIKKNIYQFKKMEPYYNWKEIREVLLGLSKDLCK